MRWIVPSEKDTDNAALDDDAFGRICEYFLGELVTNESPAAEKLVSEKLSGEKPSLDLTLLNPNHYA